MYRSGFESAWSIDPEWSKEPLLLQKRVRSTCLGVSLLLVSALGCDQPGAMPGENAVGVISRDRFSELLDGPLRRGMRRHIDMKESAARMLNHDEHIEDAE